VEVEPPEGDNVEGNGKAPEEKTFSQEDLDRLIKERLKREKDKYADYKDLKAQAEKWAEHEEAQKTEIDKAHDKAQKAEAERDEALAQANERLMRAAFVAEAAKANVSHPEDAYMLADLSEVEITDDGAVSGVEGAVKALVEAGRLVIRKQAAPSLDAGAGGGTSAVEQAAQTLTEEQLKAAHKMGLKPDEYAKGLRYKRSE
jgi:hypothetical protein